MVAVSNWIDGLSPETLAKIRALKESTAHHHAAHFTQRERVLAEFADMYGWEAVRDVQSNRIPASSFLGLLEAGRSIRLQHRVEHVGDMYNAIAAAMSKDGGRKLESMMKRMQGGA